MRHLPRVLLVFILVALGSQPAAAMRFKLVTTSGQVVVSATGDIVTGDARRLTRALAKASLDKFGTRKLLLDSAGGQVVEAFKMAEVLDKIAVTILVPKGAVCASACASILFVSGKYRTVAEGGALAIHSCFDTSNGRPMKECNALIADHADYVGASGKAVMALQQAAGTEAVFLIDQKGAACLGLSRVPGKKASKATCLTEAMKAAKN